MRITGWEKWAVVGAVTSSGFAAFSAGVTAYQAKLLSDSLSTPFEANLQVKRIDVCADLIASVDRWVGLRRMQHLVAVGDLGEGIIDDARKEEIVENISELMRDSGHESRAEMIVAANLVMPDPAIFGSFGDLYSSLDTRVFMEIMLEGTAGIAEATQRGILIDESELVALNDEFLAQFESIKQICRDQANIKDHN